MSIFKRTPRAYNLEDSQRLALSHNEPPLREKPVSGVMLDRIREAKRYGDTPQISRVDNSKK